MFSQVSLSFCPQGLGIHCPPPPDQADTPQTRQSPPRQGRHPHRPGRHPPRPPAGRDGHCSGCYASYWNAFLLQLQSPVNTRRNATSPVTFATEIESILNNPRPKEFGTRSQTPKNTSGISLQISREYI